MTFVQHSMPPITSVDFVNLDEVVVHEAGTGQRVTEPVAEAMAANHLRDHHPGLVPGGKTLSRDGTHSPVVQTRVSRATHDALTARAAAEQMSVSKLLRGIIEEHLAA